jgi:hypothetical protein
MLNAWKFILPLFLLVACSKDKVPVPTIVEPTKWELIPGDYDVFTENSDYLYSMTLNYIKVPMPNGSHKDSLVFSNFDGQFNFGSLQDLSDISKPYYITVGQQSELHDSLGKRWKIYSDWENSTSNMFSNDTIYLSFVKTNINYWIEDLVPFYECHCKQIAVKQH